MQTSDAITAVVGCGIIGVAIAYTLQKRGRNVLIIEGGQPGCGASFGNMGSIAVTEFLPSSRPAVWRQMPRWLVDPEGPVRLRPAYLPRMLPWLLRYIQAGWPSRVRAIEAATAALCRRVYDDLTPLLEETGLSSLLTDEGCLRLYCDEAELASDRDHLAALDRFGFCYERLTGEELRVLEPGLSGVVKKGFLLPQNRTVRDPYQLVLGLLEQFRARGGNLMSGRAIAFDRTDAAVTAVQLDDGRRIEVSEVVLAAGAFTGILARSLGETIPLETERGYHTQISSPGMSLRHSLIYPSRAFMVSPIAGGIRVGGTVEMAGLAAVPDFRRSRITVRHAKYLLPALRPEQATEWMGHRPALPDTLPIISRSAKTRGLFYATGHGHLGLTCAATTARLIADLVTNRPPPLDMTPYRVDRFRGSQMTRAAISRPISA